MVAFAIAATTPPRSGSNCLTNCITYPYTDAAEFVPRDYLMLAGWHGTDLGYRFEVTSLALDWLVLIVAGIMLSILFRRSARPPDRAAHA